MKPMSQTRAEEIRRAAHAALDEKLKDPLNNLKSTTHVSEEKLERMVKGCMDEVSQSVLGKLLELEPWLEEILDRTHTQCPDCATICERACGKDGQLLYEDVTLETVFGPVPWRAPLFDCRRCRRFFSPRKDLF